MSSILALSYMYIIYFDAIPPITFMDFPVAPDDPHLFPHKIFLYSHLSPC